jgi:hypothetical protein
MTSSNSFIAAIQKHFQQKVTLLIPQPIESVQSKFAQLAAASEEEVFPFYNPFKLKFTVEWDGISAMIHGPRLNQVWPLNSSVVIRSQDYRAPRKIA